MMVKRPEREADHSPPSSAEVKNGGAYLDSPVRLDDGGKVLRFTLMRWIWKRYKYVALLHWSSRLQQYHEVTN
jgi:hypothetical protein